MTALLELRDITVRVGARLILDVPALAVEPGETLAVLGANGAGKSTLLRVAGALRTPTSGDLLLDGHPAAESAIRSSTAAVLQRPLLRRGSVRMNVMTGLRVRGHPRRTAAAAAQPWLERLGLAELAERSAASISGGEAQRVSLARAFAVAPRLLLLDEPFTALDTPTRGQLLADLRHLLRETATAALFVTHDRHEAAAVADRLAILDGGSLRQLGPAGAVVDHPADVACARLLGYDNILPASTAASIGGSGLQVIRPRDLHLLTGGRLPATHIALSAHVTRAVTLGPDTRIEGTTDDGTPIIAIVPTDVFLRSSAIAEATAITLMLDPASVRTVPHPRHA